MQRIESRLEGEAGAAGLSRYFAAHCALERASAVRSIAVHVLALLGVPAVLCVVLSASLRAREVALAVFAIGACFACATLVGELRCRRELRRAESGVRVEPCDPW